MASSRIIPLVFSAVNLVLSLRIFGGERGALKWHFFGLIVAGFLSCSSNRALVDVRFTSLLDFDRR